MFMREKKDLSKPLKKIALKQSHIAKVASK